MVLMNEEQLSGYQRPGIPGRALLYKLQTTKHGLSERQKIQDVAAVCLEGPWGYFAA